MKNLKKFLVIIVSLAMIIVMVACGEKKNAPYVSDCKVESRINDISSSFPRYEVSVSYKITNPTSSKVSLTIEAKVYSVIGGTSRLDKTESRSYTLGGSETYSGGFVYYTTGRNSTLNPRVEVKVTSWNNA